MSPQTLQLDDALYGYLIDNSLREAPILSELRTETADHPAARMQIAPEQGQFMGLLVKLIGARRTLDIGTFTGYSALAVAMVLPDDGQVIACDVDPEATSIATRFWDRAGCAEKIDLRLGPATETLALLRDEGGSAAFDFAFIDADKHGYGDYYELSLELLRPGGLIAVDNIFFAGEVLNAREGSGAAAIHSLTVKIKSDERVDSSLVPIGDGLMLARKR